MSPDAPDYPQPNAPSAGEIPREPPSASSLRPPDPAAPSLRGPAAVILLFALALLVCVAAYLALAVPAVWFPGVAAKTWHAQDMALTRGDGALVGSELVITAPDPTGTVLVTLTPDLRDALLDALAGSGSDYLLLPIQDVFGWRDRINVPATVNDENWTWRFRWPVDTLDDEPEARARTASLRALCRRYGRGAKPSGNPRT